MSLISLRKPEPMVLQDGTVMTFDHYMLTIGSIRCGLRVTRGNLDSSGTWHNWRPDIFLLLGGDRVTHQEALFRLARRLV